MDQLVRRQLMGLPPQFHNYHSYLIICGACCTRRTKAKQTNAINNKMKKTRSSLVPRLSRNANMYCGESLVSLLHKHDVIKIGLKQKGNVFASTLGVYDIRCPIARYM